MGDTQINKNIMRTSSINLILAQDSGKEIDFDKLDSLNVQKEANNNRLYGNGRSKSLSKLPFIDLNPNHDKKVKYLVEDKIEREEKEPSTDPSLKFRKTWNEIRVKGLENHKNDYAVEKRKEKVV